MKSNLQNLIAIVMAIILMLTGCMVMDDSIATQTPQDESNESSSIPIIQAEEYSTQTNDVFTSTDGSVKIGFFFGSEGHI